MKIIKKSARAAGNPNRTSFGALARAEGSPSSDAAVLQDPQATAGEQCVRRRHAREEDLCCTCRPYRRAGGGTSIVRAAASTTTTRRATRRRGIGPLSLSVSSVVSGRPSRCYGARTSGRSPWGGDSGRPRASHASGNRASGNRSWYRS